MQPVEPPQFRVTFDTNVYIAALLRPGLSEELVKRGLRGDFSIITSEWIIEELKRKLTDKFSFPQDQQDTFIELVRAAAVFIDPKDGKEVVKLRDQKDLPILNCAATGKSSLLITLDQDLLSLREYQQIRIVHPKTFSWIVTQP